MEIPVNEIKAPDIAAAATQTVSGNDFTLQHNNRAVLLVTLAGMLGTYTSSGTTAIADGVKAGHELTICLVDKSMANIIIIQDNANTKLQGNWTRKNNESWLKLVWDGSDWVQVAANDGIDNNASGSFAHVEGSGNTASGDAAHVEGESNTANGLRAHAEGNSNFATGKCSHASGIQSLAGQKYQYAHGGNRFTSVGDAQYSRFVCRRAVTPNATPAVIGIDASAIGPVIAADTAWTFRAEVIGTAVDGGAISSAIIEGCLKRAGATVSAPSAATVTVIHADDADIVFTAVADNTNKSLNISVTDATNGAVAYRFVATIHVTQITFT